MIEEVQPGIGPGSEIQQRLDEAKGAAAFRGASFEGSREEPAYDPHDGLPGRPHGAGEFLAQERAHSGVYEGARIPEWTGPVPRERGQACWPPFHDPSCESVWELECGREEPPPRPVVIRVPKAVPFATVMELWAVHEVGTLTRIVQRPNEGNEEGYGVDEARDAWEWVARTPGWDSDVREAMLHLEVRQKGWHQWPSEPPSAVGRLVVEVQEASSPYCQWPERPYCPWPFLTRERAQSKWFAFFRALRRRYREEPFVIFVKSTAEG